jgi:hypothetical protein
VFSGWQSSRKTFAGRTGVGRFTSRDAVDKGHDTLVVASAMPNFESAGFRNLPKIDSE